jgi:hypothetical protein
VAGEPDLLHPAPGQRLEVAVDRDWLPPDVAPGSTVQLDATVAGPDVVRAVWRSDGPAVRVVS